MNRQISLGLVLTILTLIGFTGCASLESGDTEQLLSAAGFRSRTPTTPKQQELFAAMTPYKLERRTVQGKVLYTYADPKRNLVFIGGETEYQAYTRLGLQQEIAQSNLAAAEMNQDAAMDFDAWGPWGMWW
jgi:hypothetical protein